MFSMFLRLRLRNHNFKDGNVGRVMRADPQLASKKREVGSVIQPIGHNAQLARANSGAGQVGPLTRAKKNKVMYLCQTLMFEFIQNIERKKCQ